MVLLHETPALPYETPALPSEPDLRGDRTTLQSLGVRESQAYFWSPGV